MFYISMLSVVLRQVFKRPYLVSGSRRRGIQDEGLHLLRPVSPAQGHRELVQALLQDHVEVLNGLGHLVFQDPLKLVLLERKSNNLARQEQELIHI